MEDKLLFSYRVIEDDTHDTLPNIRNKQSGVLLCSATSR